MAEGKVVVAEIHYQVVEITKQHIDTLTDTNCLKNNKTK